MFKPTLQFSRMWYGLSLLGVGIIWSLGTVLLVFGCYQFGVAVDTTIYLIPAVGLLLLAIAALLQVGRLRDCGFSGWFTLVSLTALLALPFTKSPILHSLNVAILVTFNILLFFLPGSKNMGLHLKPIVLVFSSLLLLGSFCTTFALTTVQLMVSREHAPTWKQFFEQRENLRKHLVADRIRQIQIAKRQALLERPYLVGKIATFHDIRPYIFVNGSHPSERQWRDELFNLHLDVIDYGVIEPDPYQATGFPHLRTIGQPIVPIHRTYPDCDKDSDSDGDEENVMMG